MNAPIGTTAQPQSVARRFHLHLPLRYRPAGEERWYDGITENISASGVLFRARHVFGPETPVEISLALPLEESKPSTVSVHYTGAIVRLELPRESNQLPALGAKFFHHQISGQLPAEA